jgi:hypothetical protein
LNENYQDMESSREKKLPAEETRILRALVRKNMILEVSVRMF